MAGFRWKGFAAEGVGVGGIGPEGADFNFLWLLSDEIVVEDALLVDVSFDDARGEATREAAMFAGFKKDTDSDVGVAPSFQTAKLVS